MRLSSRITECSTALATRVSAEQASVPAAYRIIVHPKNPVSSIERKFLEDAFLKKTTRWPNQGVIRPVDQTANTQARRRFSKDVLERSIAAVKAYWQQRIFSGRDAPPPELDTDEKVTAFVLRHEGAVGYVSGAAELHGTKAVHVTR